jgi:uncharacterized membrane protein
MTSLFLQVVAAIFGVFGLIYLFDPGWLAGAAGVQGNASGLTDIRATYGGFQIGFCLYLVWVIVSQQRIAGLVACALVSGSVAIGRIVGLAVDGGASAFNLVGLAVEIPILLLSVWLYRREISPAG